MNKKHLIIAGVVAAGLVWWLWPRKAAASPTVTVGKGAQVAPVAPAGANQEEWIRSYLYGGWSLY